MTMHYAAGYSVSLCGFKRSGSLTEDDGAVTCRKCRFELRRIDEHARKTMTRDEQPKQPLVRSSMWAGLGRLRGWSRRGNKPQ